MGDRIRKLRKALGLTQRQLAESVGVSVSAVCNWEAGLRRPGYPVLRLVAGTLKTSVDHLLP